METDLQHFHYKKSLGQNFITDSNLLRAVVFDAGVTKEDVVLEIGTGAGTLTKELCKVAKKVVSFEVDTELGPIVRNTLEGCDNYTLVFRDVLKMTDDELRVWVPDTFKVVANLPYYVTTPMIMRFAESDLAVTSMTLMMQQEVADRLTAKENTPEYGAITASLNAVADVVKTREIDRRMFYPRPNVDSALVRIDFNREKYAFRAFDVFKKTVKAAFLMRRKTLVNNLVAFFSLPKDVATELVCAEGFSPTVRGEALSVQSLVSLSDRLAAFLKQS